MLDIFLNGITAIQDTQFPSKLAGCNEKSQKFRISYFVELIFFFEKFHFLVGFYLF